MRQALEPTWTFSAIRPKLMKFLSGFNNLRYDKIYIIDIPTFRRCWLPPYSGYSLLGLN